MTFLKFELAEFHTYGMHGQLIFIQILIICKHLNLSTSSCQGSTRRFFFKIPGFQAFRQSPGRPVLYHEKIPCNLHDANVYLPFAPFHIAINMAVINKLKGREKLQVLRSCLML